MEVGGELYTSIALSRGKRSPVQQSLYSPRQALPGTAISLQS
jgi:hypothetical protein